MPHTRAEEQALTEDVTEDVLGLFFAVIKKLMPEKEALKLYMSLAGDSSPEQRQRIGVYCSQIEHKIDRKLARRRASIEKCYRFALKATTTEERDVWNDMIRTHVDMIAELEDLRISVLRLLVICNPYPSLVRSALMFKNRGTANTQLVPAALERQVARLLSGTGAIETTGTAPIPPEEKEEEEKETETVSGSRSPAQ